MHDDAQLSSIVVRRPTEPILASEEMLRLSSHKSVLSQSMRSLAQGILTGHADNACAMAVRSENVFSGTQVSLLYSCYALS